MPGCGRICVYADYERKLEMHRIDPPKEVIHIIDVLTQHSYEAYAVGGCIRDSVMGRQPKDWDITTSAYPDAVKELFEKTVDTGLRHGTVTVMMGGGSYEVTTFRIDGRYEDARRPEYVEFTGRLEDDLRRRDFTINSMAWNAQCGIIDPFGGMRDIETGTVRAVGTPAERFKEDALRMLRAVRFAASLGFGIEKSTFEAIKSNCGLIRKISAERIREELTGILFSDDPAKFSLLAECGLLSQILGKFGYKLVGTGNERYEDGSCADSSSSAVNMYSVEDPCADGTDESAGMHELQLPNDLCLSSVGAVEADICLRWAMLLRCFAVSAGIPEQGGSCGYEAEADGTGTGAGKGKAGENEAKTGVPYEEFIGISEDILAKLKFSNKNIDKTLRLLKWADMQIEPEPGDVAKAVFAAGEDIFPDLLKLKRACALTLSPDSGSGADGHNSVDEIEKIYRDLMASGRCLKLKDLAVNGQDLMRIGYREGVDIGNALSYLLGRVLKEPELNRKDKLEKMALDYLGERRKQAAL